MVRAFRFRRAPMPPVRGPARGMDRGNRSLREGRGFEARLLAYGVGELIARDSEDKGSEILWLAEPALAKCQHGGQHGFLGDFFLVVAV